MLKGREVNCVVNTRCFRMLLAESEIVHEAGSLSLPRRQTSSQSTTVSRGVGHCLISTILKMRRCSDTKQIRPAKPK